ATGERETLLNAPTMFQAAQRIGRAIRLVYETESAGLAAGQLEFELAFLFGGQIKDGPLRLYMIYAAGNFIECTTDTPYLQIGEHKYGKPILDRVARPTMGLGEAAKLILLSFDSTLRSNLSVGMPIDILLYERDSLDVSREKRIFQDDEYFKKLSTLWSEALRSAFTKIEEFDV
ncbi:MAG: peptidase, partial [Hyphomicrobium sp.]|nr:peptidase [Hyphomicrobium sp.]